jgi:hypothetical protein
MGESLRKIQLSPRRRYRRAAMIAGLAAAAGLIVAGASAASAASASSSRPSGHAAGPLPTVVLEHGAWANGASWNAVVQRLQADGYTKLA